MAGKPIELHREVSWRPGSNIHYRCDVCGKEFDNNIVKLKDCPYCTPVAGCDIWTPIDLADAITKTPIVVRHLMPEWRLIPDVYKGGSPWARVAKDWYINGLNHAEWQVKPGIDKEKAFQHVKAIFAVEQVKIEHRIAAIAYLLDQWFYNVEYDTERR
jgi:hypothetical protein